MVDNQSTEEFIDVFNRDVFQQVLRNTMAARELLRYTTSNFCSENLTFLYKVEKFHYLIDQLSDVMKSINEIYLVDDAPEQINIEGVAAQSLTRNINRARTTLLPPLRHMFDSVRDDIQDLLYMDVYPRFVKYKMGQSAARALAENKQSNYYQGLGDCFCFTSPSLPDNPIVYASDGFIRVTGYSRKEIMNRNCRFLQGKYTDRKSVKGLRDGIRTRTETVQLLLNYRKDGTPFWNLLYVAPLMGADGKCEFFLGGQINLSTNIHDKLDIMQILSYTAQAERKSDTNDITSATKPHQNPKPQNETKRRILDNIKAALVSQPGDALETGIEGEMLHRMQEMGLRQQMEAFYNAYRQYMVLRFSDLKVLYHSPNLLEACSSTSTSPLTPPSSLPASPLVYNYSRQRFDVSLSGSNALNAKNSNSNSAAIAGTDAFDVLFSITRNLKAIKAARSSVRKSLKAGIAITSKIEILPVTTSTVKPGLGRENGFNYTTPNGSGESIGNVEDLQKINVHWTPLKDENGVSDMVIVILG